MIAQKAYPAEPWQVRETALDLGVLAQSESVFALSNGHIGLRANLDEGEPHALPGTYLNSVYEERPLPYAEAGYGYPPSGQTVINVANGKLIRLLVNDEPFDVRYGRLRRHERILDLRAGVLRRDCEWTSPAGVTVQVNSTRLVSFVYRSIAAIEYQVRAVSDPIQVVLQSELVANEQLPPMSGDPRAAAVLEAPLQAELHERNGAGVVLIHQTRRSGRRTGAGMTHIVDCDSTWTADVYASEDVGRYMITARLQPGETLRLVKLLAYGWSSQRSLPAIRAQVEAALTAARASGWEWLVAAQRDYLDDFWRRADVELDGDDEVQQAVRFALFHVLQASARAERRPIAAKGLTGTGYDGHAFWDTETCVLPVLTYTAPAAAADALRWRHMIIPAATAERYRARAGHCGVSPEEIARWRAAADGVVVVYDERLGVHPQSENFTKHAPWDFANTPPQGYPLLLHYPYFQLYRKQVVKQSDLVLAMHLRGDAFTPEQKLRNFDYYEGLTVRDSSLSACTQAGVGGEVHQRDLA